MIHLIRKYVWPVMLRIPPLILFDQISQFGMFNVIDSYSLKLTNRTLFDIDMSGDYTTEATTTSLDVYTMKTDNRMSHLFQNTTDVPAFESYFEYQFLSLVYLPLINGLFSITGSFYVLFFIVKYIACAACLLVCFLDLELLLNLYKFTLSLSILIVSYVLHSQFSMITFDQITQIESYLDTFRYRIVLQFTLLHYTFGYIFWHIFLINWHSSETVVDVLVPVLFAVPTLAGVIVHQSYHQLILNSVTCILMAAVISVLVTNSKNIVHSLIKFYTKKVIFFNNYGLISFFDFEWNRLRVPSVLRCFWFIQLMKSTSIFLINNTDKKLFEYATIKFTLSHCCDSIMMVIGLSAIVGKIFYIIYEAFRWILSADDLDEGISTSMTVLNFVLSLQTGLTELDDDKRFRRLLKNFCLILMAFFHCIHSVVNHTLLALSVPYKPYFWKHFRALFVTLTLIAFPIAFIRVLFHFNEVSTWLIAILAFGVECVTKYSISIVIYVLYLIDSRSEEVWEQLDDYVYYIQTFGSILDFLFGILLFMNGLWILVFERGSAIRAIMMGVHVYQNIWMEAKTGWINFRKRRTAAHKINSLQDASSDQLQLLNDVCSICFQEMITAKMTKCNHFFHMICLKKWLYVQDHCPLCHEVLHALVAD